MLPQMTNEQLFVTDAGLETDLIFNRGIELPEFAAFVLIDDESGMQALKAYYAGFFEIAKEHDAGVVLDTPTWRANRDWGERLGYDSARLADVNKRWVQFAGQMRDDWDGNGPVVISGNIGPRGDGYVPGEQMTPDEAATYHGEQIATLTD